MGIKPAGIPLKVLADGITLQQSSEVLSILASGVSTAQLANSSISTAKLQPSAVGVPNINFGVLVLVSSISVAAATSSISFANLNGEVDKGYILYAQIKNDAGATSVYTLRPNGLTANQLTRIIRGDGSTVTSAFSSLITMATCGANRGTGIVCDIFPMIGATRTIIPRSHYAINTDDRVEIASAEWDNSTTSITSLEVRSDTALGIGTLSFIQLFKRA